MKKVSYYRCVKKSVITIAIIAVLVMFNPFLTTSHTAEIYKLEGTVVNKLSDEYYIYLQIKSADNSKFWLFMGTAPVNIGDDVTCNSNALLKDYKNRQGFSLNEVYVAQSCKKPDLALTK
jgi:hypothetical protein